MEALLFGSIGSVCETSDLQRHGFNQAFDEHALDWYWSEDDYRRLLKVTGGRERIRAFAREDSGLVLDESLVAQVHDRKTEVFNELLGNGGAPVRPGVARLIDGAKQDGLKVGFITTTEHANLLAIESALGDSFSLSDFDIVTDRLSIEHEKPSPAVYGYALAQLGVGANEAIAIEDTESCVASAVDAGVCCIATPHFYSTGQDFDKAFACLTHLGDSDRMAELLDGNNIVAASGLVTIESLSAALESRQAAA